MGAHTDLHVLWSVKGGAGVTVCAAALAAAASKMGQRVILVDLAGDLPTLLGVGHRPGPAGVLDWLAGDRHPVEALDRILIEVTPDIAMLPRGGGGPDGLVQDIAAGRVGVLSDWLLRRRGVVVVDAGRYGTSGVDPAHVAVVAELAGVGNSWLVTRACYLSLWRAQAGPRPDGVVLIEEPGRSLDRRDVAAVLPERIATVVEADPSVARAADCGGLLRDRIRPLNRAMRVLL